MARNAPHKNRSAGARSRAEEKGRARPPQNGDEHDTGISTAVAGGLIAVAAAYLNSLAAPFVLDDVPSIVDNPTIRRLWPPTVPLSPPRGSGLTVAGRPLLNLSFALNYALSGTAAWSYHVLNVVIHVAAGLALFGILRRTFRLPRLPPRFGERSNALAAVAALIWTLHPLQTESVTYVVQRAESLCGLFYLLTLYAFIRGASGAPSRLWLAASQAACLMAMATKEVAATAPFIVLLYDRTFLAGSFARAWRERRLYYAGLFATLILLAWLAASAGSRGGTAGFGGPISSWSYALTQCRALLTYLRLSLWPAPLVFDYGSGAIADPTAVIPEALLLLALAIATLYALRRQPAIGFLGVWFFAVLAPTSSVAPVTTQTMAEHRVYLSLAGVVVLALVLLDLGLGRRAVWVGAAAALALAALTVRRNDVYRTAIGLWTDTVAKRPENARAQNNLGLALAAAGRPLDGMDHLVEAVRLEPASAEFNNNVAVVLVDLGHLPEAMTLIDEVLRSAPGLAAAHDTRGRILKEMGRPEEARAAYDEALRRDPRLAEAHNNLGLVLVELGRLPEAVSHYEEAIRLRPDSSEARANLEAARLQLDRQRNLGAAAEKP